MINYRAVLGRGYAQNSAIRSMAVDTKGRIPYGLSNWGQFRRNQFVYVDRTQVIAKLDATTVHSCLWSPRRTGKSLLCNQLALWHDKAISKDERIKLFSGTYIAENPSLEAGKYLVLHLDFSKVDEKDVPGTFTKVVNASVSEFSEKYYKIGLLKRPVVIDRIDCMSSISDLASTVRLSGQTLSLIVDEVDSFANRLLVQVSREKGLGASGHQEFIKKEGSMLRQFGRVVKSESNTCIEKMFFTGVMPVTWSDAFSSLNTVEDLTHTNAFQYALGFTTSDIRELLIQLFPQMAPDDRDTHVESIQSTCISYRRSSSQVHNLYNPQGVWYYLKHLQDKGNQMVPRMDPNIVQSGRDEVAAFLVRHAAAAKTYSPVHFFEGYIPFSPHQRFSTEFLFDPVRAPEALLSMAHYCGYLTCALPHHEVPVVHVNRLVASNDAIKEVFMSAVLESLPGQYKDAALKWILKNVPRAAVVKEMYNAQLTGDLSGVGHRLSKLVRDN